MSTKRALSEDDLRSPDRYSDDFSSDEDKRTPTPKRVTSPRRNSDQRRRYDKLRGRGSGSVRSTAPRGQGLKKGRRNSRSSEPIDMKKNHDSITTRVLSASRNRINELRNKIEELKIKIRDLEQENRLYKRMQFRQEKTIRVFEDKENDLPMILDKHNNEIRTLKELNRQLKEKFDKTNRYLRDAEDELERVKKKMNKYKEMCEDKELIERDELNRRLMKAEQEMEEKDVRLRDLQRHVEVLKKNHRHELGIEMARQKDLRKHVEELSERNSQLENQLKNKEKALEYQNIHSNPRQGRTSRNTSPDISQARKARKKAPAMVELTPRDKAKFYAEKQRAEVLKQKELKDGRKKVQKWEAEKEEDDPPKSPPEFSFSTHNRRVEDTSEEGEKIQQDRDGKDKLDLQKMQAQENEGRFFGEEMARKEHDELRGWDAKEKNEESNRKEVKEMRKVLEKEKREKEKAEQERRLKMEKEKMANDPKLQAERKKKDELLKKLQALDEKGNDTSSKIPSSNKDKEYSQTYESGDGPNSHQFISEPKEFFLTKPTSSLHHGNPPHQKRQTQDDDSGGYLPSFGPTRGAMNKVTKPVAAFEDDDEPAFKITNNTTKQQNDKKSNLLESLFGHQVTSSKNLSHQEKRESETVFFADKSPLSNNRKSITNSTFPWETNSALTKINNSTYDSEKKSTIFGGGATLIDSDISDKPDRVHQQQQRKQNLNTFSAKPSVTAVDNFDDEIEEVVL